MSETSDSIRRSVFEAERRKERARIRIAEIVAAVLTAEALLRRQPREITDEIVLRISRELRTEIDDLRATIEREAEIRGMDVDEGDADAIVAAAEQGYTVRLTTAISAIVGAVVARGFQASVRGVTPAVIQAAMTSDRAIAQIVSSVAGAAKRETTALLAEVANLPMTAIAISSPETRGLQSLTWITVGDENVCEDSFETSCEPRHGEVLTTEEWQGLGVPGSTNLLCCSFGRSQCRCELIPEELSAGVERVTISDEVEAGKNAAREELG